MQLIDGFFVAVCGVIGGVVSYIGLTLMQRNVQERQTQYPQFMCVRCGSKKLKPLGNEADKLICSKCYTIYQKEEPNENREPPIKVV